MGMQRFVDKVVLVTGAGTGLGRAIARQAHVEGALLAAVDVNVESVAKLAVELGTEPVVPVELDVRKSAAIDTTVSELLERFGGIDVLINNAGIADGLTAAVETTDELWEDVLGVNLAAPFRLARCVLPSMLDRGSGAIVNVASVASLKAGSGGAAYTASKHGLLGLTRSLALEYGPKGIRVNAVLPGPMRTDLLLRLASQVEGSDTAIAAFPAGRLAEPEEVARAVAFLASDEASFAYGSAFVVDGGWTLV